MRAISIFEEAPALRDRITTITLGGREYRLMLSTGATLAIKKRFGGLDALSDTITNVEKFEDAFNDLVWLIVLLANQPILLHNLWHPEDRLPLLTEEEILLISTPGDIAAEQEKIALAMQKGVNRAVPSEVTEEKNTPAG